MAFIKHAVDEARHAVDGVKYAVDEVKNLQWPDWDPTNPDGQFRQNLADLDKQAIQPIVDNALV